MLLSCFCLGIFIVTISEYGEAFPFDASGAYPADYFWDENGSFVLVERSYN